MAEKETTYQVVAICGNCGHVPKKKAPDGTIIEPLQYNIPLGMESHDFLFAQTCPNCGCKGHLARAIR